MDSKHAFAGRVGKALASRNNFGSTGVWNETECFQRLKFEPQRTRRSAEEETSTVDLCQSSAAGFGLTLPCSALQWYTKTVANCQVQIAHLKLAFCTWQLLAATPQPVHLLGAKGNPHALTRVS